MAVQVVVPQLGESVVEARVARWLYRNYFRANAFGIEHIPAHGRVLFVANHSGQLPFDGLVIGAAAFLEPRQPRLVRSMVEYFVPTVPFASYLFARWGQITGTPENCRRLLAAEEAVLDVAGQARRERDVRRVREQRDEQKCQERQQDRHVTPRS